MSTFADILDHMREIHEAKNNDYSPEGEFGNFAESERVGVEAWRGAFIRLQDKYTRCCNLIQGKEQMVKDEALEDTLLDLANYAVIVLCLRKFERDEVRPDVPGNPFEPDAVFHDHSERTAAEETLRWRQEQPNLADLVDWSEAPEWATHAVQNYNGEIWFTDRVLAVTVDGIWCIGNKKIYKTASLAHDWQAPLKRPVDHTYTDEEPEHRLRYRDSGVPSDMPYAEIPVTEQEDEEFELMCVRRNKRNDGGS